MNPTAFVALLADVRLDNVFNPYIDTCPVFDRHDAAAYRRGNLRTFLAAAVELEVDTIWMGRDLGHRGGRRTGVALTDEYHLSELEQLYPGSKSRQATLGPAMAERTAAEVWEALRRVPRPPLLWNVFPFHPHEAGTPLSNRRFTARELRRVDEINRVLLDWLGIERIVAIGQDAARYASGFGVDVLTVRHPSYGGVREFREGIRSLYPAMHSRRRLEPQSALV